VDKVMLIRVGALTIAKLRSDLNPGYNATPEKLFSIKYNNCYLLPATQEAVFIFRNN
jgi:hypothetical protein